MNIITSTYSSPCGDLILGSFGDSLCLCDWAINNSRRDAIVKRIETELKAKLCPGDSECNHQAKKQLDKFFAGRRKQFELPLKLIGTDFQKSVWLALQDIPFGSTISYAELSLRIGRAKAYRAVASANRANAISIIIPCHRVIGKNNELAGYAGGLPAKKYLIDLEKKLTQ